MDVDVVDYHLGRLTPRACRAFVADLWAARGYETRVEGDVVVATRRDETAVLFPACGSHFRAASSPTRSVDVVVAPAGGSAAATIATRHDARLLDAADLRRMLRYAVSPATAEMLCERHLGAVPSALEPSGRTRIRRRIDGLRALELPAGSTVGVAVLLFVVVAGLAFSGGQSTPVGPASTGVSVDADAAAAGGGDVTDDSATAVAEPTDRPSRPTDDSRSTGRWRSVDADAPVAPGVNATGVTNLTTLVTAHDRALGAQSYTIWADTYRPYNGVPSADRAQRDTDIAVDGDRYLVRESLERDDGRRLVRAVYYDGTDWYVDDRSTGERMVRWVDGTTAESVDPDPRTLRTALVTYYLDTPRSNVTGQTQVGERTAYRLEGSGPPPAFAVQEVYNYEFVAVVDERGFVREATVEYTVVSVEGSYRLQFEWTYDRLNATTVTEPAWVGLANPETATPTATTPNRTPANRTTAPERPAVSAGRDASAPGGRRSSGSLGDAAGGASGAR